jgi:NAD(P)-dependent dehydrogenase (short-subunit alcohol dehydrogenase family)
MTMTNDRRGSDELTATDAAIRHQDAAGMRTLIVGASSGIGQAFAIAARERGASVALAARRFDRLALLAENLGGLAYELDVSNAEQIENTVEAAAAGLGGLDAIMFSSAVLPFAHVRETDITTWVHAYAVNAMGASHLLRCALPHLSSNSVVLVASSHDVGRPRIGAAAYNASKAALDEVLRSWRCEHPELGLVRVGIGPTEGTEILRGADRELLPELYRAWREHGQMPTQTSAVADVAHTLVSIIAAARANPSVIPEVIHLAPRHTG